MSDYHSADYDHDWKISSAELARVTVLANTEFNGVKTGCYKVDSQSIDGFAPDNQRALDEPVTLKKYHSADYNKDGRIDEAELQRVTQLANYFYTLVSDSSTVVTGQYHAKNPFSLDSFGGGPVSLEFYQFDEHHKPRISSNSSLGANYVLRAKMTGSDGISYQTAVTLNNSGARLDSLPPPGIYTTELYWLQFDSSGNATQLGDTCLVTVTIGQPRHCEKSCHGLTSE